MKLSYLQHGNREFGERDPHLAMQVHRGCHIDTCATKAAAFSTLVADGKIRPDSSRYMRSDI